MVFSCALPGQGGQVDLAGQARPAPLAASWLDRLDGLGRLDRLDGLNRLARFSCLARQPARTSSSSAAHPGALACFGSLPSVPSLPCLPRADEAGRASHASQTGQLVGFLAGQATKKPFQPAPHSGSSACLPNADLGSVAC